jgi:hypothetical protein
VTQIGGLRIPLTAEEFAESWSRVRTVINTDARLPAWPFSRRGGLTAVGQYGRLMGADFIPVLGALSKDHGDDKVFLVVVDPTPSYYVTNYGFYPGFELDVAGLTAGYWPGLSYEPGDDPTGAIAYTANDVAVVGSTGAWAVWGQRDWDVVLVQGSNEGSWLTAGVPFVPPAKALEDFTAVERWANPLSPEDSSSFLSNFAIRAEAHDPPDD